MRQIDAKLKTLTTKFAENYMTLAVKISIAKYQQKNSPKYEDS